jgi:hypothetical protein
MFWIFAITVAPAGGSGTLPLLPDPLLGVVVVEPEPELPVVEEEPVEVDPLEVPEDVPEVVPVDDDPAALVDDPDEVEDEDDDDPEELDEPEAMAALVVLAVVVAVFGLAHPITAKTTSMNVPTAQNPFRFNCIRAFPPVGGRQSGQIRGASTLDVSGEATK